MQLDKEMEGKIPQPIKNEKTVRRNPASVIGLCVVLGIAMGSPWDTKGVAIGAVFGLFMGCIIILLGLHIIRQNAKKVIKNTIKQLEEHANEQ